MLDNLRIMWHQGKQFIPDVTTARVPGIFRGRPVISGAPAGRLLPADLCPTKAISANPLLHRPWQMYLLRRVVLLNSRML